MCMPIAAGRDRPWVLDPLPYLISAREWRSIEAGVAQRARLLNAVLVDLYGKQELLARGALPPEIPFGHPNYLWPCEGIRLPNDRWLHRSTRPIWRGRRTGAGGL